MLTSETKCQLHASGRQVAFLKLVCTVARRRSVLWQDTSRQTAQPWQTAYGQPGSVRSKQHSGCKFHSGSLRHAKLASNWLQAVGQWLVQSCCSVCYTEDLRMCTHEKHRVLYRVIQKSVCTLKNKLGVCCRGSEGLVRAPC